MGTRPFCTVVIARETYHLYKSRQGDINEAHVFVRNARLKSQFQDMRRAVCFTRGRARLYCELLYADSDYVDARLGTTSDRAANLIFMNGWARHRLGIERGASIDLTMKPTGFAWLWLCADHPQLIVVVASVLGLIGIGLGVVGIGVGLMPFSPIGGICAIVIGFIVLLGSLGLLYRRVAQH